MASHILTLLLTLLACLGVAQNATEISFADMYASGTNFSETLVRLDGDTVTLKGYAAPPLKPDLNFFVLTRVQMAVCPFCDDEAEWPPDIILVEVPNDFDDPVFGGFQVTGKLELGAKTDPETGFVSKVRIIADSVKRP